MDVPLRDVAAFALVQGLSYALPVSSDGHLALLKLLFDIKEPAPLLPVALRATAFVATCVVLRAPCLRLLRELAASVTQPSRLFTTTGGRDAVSVFCASIPTLIFGVFLRERVQTFANSPLVIGVGLLGTSAWLLSTHWLKPGRADSPGALGAFLIGVAQGLSVIPGLSRSAGTTVCALWLGLRPDRAFEISFLSSLPALLAMVLLDGRSALHSPVEPSQLALGIVTSLVAVSLGLALVSHAVRRGRLALFSAWTLPLALATLAMALAWPH